MKSEPHVDQRIAALEAENFRLRSMLAAAGVAPLPPVDLPDDDAIEQLALLVEAAQPRLGTIERAQFGLALIYLAYARRVTEPNEEYAATFWLDDCRQWLKRQAYTRDVYLKAFTAAVVASGVSYLPLDNYPYDLAFALQVGGAPNASSAWADVLRSRRVPAPIEVKKRRPGTRDISLRSSALDDRRSARA